MKQYRSFDRISVIQPSFWNHILGFALFGASLSILFMKDYNSGCGDFPQHFEVARNFCIGGGILGLVFNIFHHKIPNAYRVLPILLIILRFWIASVIIGYGLVKIFPNQFPMLMANMDARFAELSPMRVAWAFFGYSKGYQMFLGWGEFIPAIMLLFRRTQLLGAFFMTIVLLNVWLVNVFFDVCVSLNSFIYFATSLYILLQEFPRLWKFFFTNYAVEPPTEISLADTQNFKIIGRSLNILLLSLIALEIFMSVYPQLSGTGFSQTKKDEIYGAYQINKIEKWDGKNWIIPSESDTCNLNRCFFEGRAGVLQGNNIRQRINYSLDSTKKKIQLSFINQRNTFYAEAKWNLEKIDAQNLKLQGKFGKDSIRFECSLRKDKLLR